MVKTSALHAAAATRQSSLIDVHHHFEPTGTNNGGRPWVLQMSLDQMDGSGVDAAIAYAGAVLGDASCGAQSKARQMNEWTANICREHPTRFGFFASLPMNDVEGALVEIAYAFDVLNADGIGIAPRYGSAWLGDSKFLPIFEELNRRRAVVYVHPARSSSCDALARLNTTDGIIAAPWIEFPTDTARTIVSLWAAGVTRTFPDIRFLFCHGGGVLPILLGRFAGFAAWHDVGPDRLAAIFPDGVYAEFAKLYFECAQAFAPEIIAMLRSLLPPSHLLFGTDFSYFPIEHSVAALHFLQLPDEIYAGVAHENARALLPRWAQPVASVRR